MSAKTLAKKILKGAYGTFPMSKNTCKCMETCVEELGKALYQQAEKYGWVYDEQAAHAIDIQLYKIGKRLSTKSKAGGK
jgi:hypothetical protein